MIEIVPAIIPKKFSDLEDSVGFVGKSAGMVQIDVVDGKFVMSKSWPYVGDRGEFDALLAEERGLPLWDNLDYEFDLMISHPEDVIDNWIVAGATSLVVHIESTKKIDEIIKNIRSRFPFNEIDGKPSRISDIELGLALNIDTPTDAILMYLEDINFVQFMGISKIGYQGQPLDERVLDKIHVFHNAHPEILIAVDGGVNLDTAKLLVEVGAKKLIAGSAVFGSPDVGGNIRNLENSF